MSTGCSDPSSASRDRGQSPAISRRTVLLGLPSIAYVGRSEPVAVREPWYDVCPSIAQVGSYDAAVGPGARVVIYNAAADPSWGPYGQRLALLDTRSDLGRLKQAGLRVLTYIEGFGDCAVYAVALERRSDGSWEERTDDPGTPVAVRTHWCWATPGLRRGNALRWVGLHACAQEQDYLRPEFTLAALGIAPPTYPDGRLATGTQAGLQEPLNAQLWDACAAKDVNGLIAPVCAPAVGAVPGERLPEDCTEGLYRAVVGVDEVEASGVAAGTVVWCGHLSIHKDLSAPFWRRCAEASAEVIARSGVDGVWCDNWSPWDNFGYPPVKRSFGEWSVAGFKRYCRAPAVRDEMRRATGCEPEALDVRRWFLDRAGGLGASLAADLGDAAWRDARWLDDPVWRHYRAARQEMARKDLRAFHEALHRGARRAGRRDFLVCGNDVPFYGLGWARDAWTDMVHTEVTPGWHMGSGSRGIMLPPRGKMAVVYRAALAHQRSRFAGAWYYVDPPYQRRENLGKVLQAEAFANGAFLLCDPQNPRVSGTVDGHAWWNRFVRRNEAHFVGREPLSDVGLVFSPDTQLALLAPGGFPDMDRQPHVFGHWGWGTLLLDQHLPYRVVPDWRLTRSGLRGLRTLILPDVECLEDIQIAAIVAWVRNGGRLVLTGACGVRRGVPGAFERRAASPFAAFGVDRPSIAPQRLGSGVVVASSEPLGAQYYLGTDQRVGLRPTLAGIVGSSELLRAIDAPASVELTLWRGRNGRTLFVDAANTDVVLEDDRVRPSDRITFEIRTGWSGADANVLSPDSSVEATVRQTGSWTRVSMTGIEYYASVMLTAG